MGTFGWVLLIVVVVVWLAFAVWMMFKYGLINSIPAFIPRLVSRAQAKWASLRKSKQVVTPPAPATSAPKTKSAPSWYHHRVRLGTRFRWWSRKIPKKQLVVLGLQVLVAGSLLTYAIWKVLDWKKSHPDWLSNLWSTFLDLPWMWIGLGAVGLSLIALGIWWLVSRYKSRKEASPSTMAAPARAQAKSSSKPRYGWIRNVIAVLVMGALAFVAYHYMLFSAIEHTYGKYSQKQQVAAYEDSPEFIALSRDAVRLPYPDSTGRAVYHATVNSKRMFVTPAGCMMGWHKLDQAATLLFRDENGPFKDGPGRLVPNNTRRDWVIVYSRDGPTQVDFIIGRDAEGFCRQQNPVRHASG